MHFCMAAKQLTPSLCGMSSSTFIGSMEWLAGCVHFLFSFKFSCSRHEMTYVMFCFYYFSATLFQFLLVLMSKFFLFVVGGRDVDIYTFVRKKSPSLGGFDRIVYILYSYK